jgi:hypothetical protein
MTAACNTIYVPVLITYWRSVVGMIGDELVTGSSLKKVGYFLRLLRILKIVIF